MAVIWDVAALGKKTYIITEPGDYYALLDNVSGTYIFEINTSGVDLRILGTYRGFDSHEYHLHTIQLHKAPRSRSDLFIKGVFQENSKFIYNGLIRIEKDAQESHAYQKNQNLILSPGAFVSSEPNLEILANEVFCTHGSTTGNLNQDEVQYVTSRGISDSAAQELLIEGFLSEVKSRIPQTP